MREDGLSQRFLFLILAVLLLMPVAAFGQVSAVVNGASFAGGPSPGSLGAVFGSNLANTTALATTVPLPYSLGGITVTVNGTAAPLWYVSSTQVNFQVPADAKPGPATVQVGSAPSFTVTIPQAAPGIFSYGSNRAIAVNLDNSLTDSSHPAAPGSVITVYLTGIGPLDNPVATDTQAPSKPLSNATLPASASIGGQNAPIGFLGLTPSGIALAQANLTVPALAAGDYPVTITIGGVTSNAPLISVGGGGGGGGTSVTQLGTLPLPDIGEGSNVILNGNVAYICGSQGIHVVDISSSSAPKLLSTFGQSDLNNAGVFCTKFGNNLLEIVNTQSLYVYSLANPTQPQSLSGQVSPPFPFAGSAFFSGNTAFFTTDWFTYFGSTIATQHGELYAYDLSNPAKPTFLSSLQPGSAPASSNLSPRFGGTAIDSTTAYIGSTTSTGGDPNGGQAAVQVIDIGNPQNMQALTQVLIPQGTVATTIVPQGNLAIVVGNTKSWRNPGTPNFDFTGVMTLTALDISNHRSPAVLSTLVTSYPTNFDGGSIVLPIGTGRFLVSIFPGADSNPTPQGSGELAILDATDPRNLKLTVIATISQLDQIALNNNILYVLSGSGLTIYQFG
jgi:uncharacterized protein (TIGR03437 family)